MQTTPNQTQTMRSTRIAGRRRRGPGRIGRLMLDSPLVGALATPHPVDRYLELVRPHWSLTEVRGEVIAVRRLTPRSVTLTIRPNLVWGGHKAGQYVRFTVEIDGVRKVRPYSPASPSRSDGEIEITVGTHDEGLVSRWIAENAAPGLIVGLSQPDGDFHLPDTRPERLVLISGGSGITPVMSMLRTLCDESSTARVGAIHYARSADEVVYRDELEAIDSSYDNVRILRSLTREAGGELVGHLTREHLIAADPDFATAETFVCGPPALIDAVREIYEAEGAEQRLHVEHFVPPAPSVVLGDAKGVLRFTESGVEIDNSGSTLLEQAEGAGLTPEHGCRMGICHSCTCRKTSGAVRNTVTGEVSALADEDIQICVSVPVSDVELEI